MGAGDRERVTVRRWRAEYLLANIFEACIGVAAAVGSVGYFFDKGSLLEASIGEGLKGFATTWSLLYFLAGLTITVGLLRMSLRIELAGLCLFFPAALLEAVTILLFAGGKGWAPGTLFAGLALATLLRAIVVWRVAESEGGEGP